MTSAAPPLPTYVMQGQLRIAQHENKVLTCILGSCVAACIRDPEARIGGMNHFLLPGADPQDPHNLRYGASSISGLISALLQRGAARRRLEVWLYGGANILGTSTGVGAANGDFARAFIAAEGLKLRGADLGGTCGRRVEFIPHTSDIQITLMDEASVP